MTPAGARVLGRDPGAGLQLAVLLSAILHLTIFFLLPAMESIVTSKRAEPPVVTVFSEKEDPVKAPESPKATPTVDPAETPSPTAELTPPPEKESAKPDKPAPKEDKTVEKAAPLPPVAPETAPTPIAKAPSSVPMPPAPSGTGNTEKGLEKPQAPSMTPPKLVPDQPVATGVQQDMLPKAADPDAVPAPGQDVHILPSAPSGVATLDGPDYGAYIIALVALLKETVWAGLPAADASVINPVVKIAIMRDGTVQGLPRLVKSSGRVEIDDAVIAGLKEKKLVPLPDSYPGDRAVLTFEFQLKRS